MKHERLLNQLTWMVSQTSIADEVEQKNKEYAEMPSVMAQMLKQVADFYSKECDQEIQQIRMLLFQLFIVVYKEANKKDSNIAKAYLYSFVDDYPEVPDSCLAVKCVNLIQAALAFQECIKNPTPLQSWEQIKALFLTYNEFLNGFLGYLIIAWRCKLGKRVNPNVFRTAYGNKVQQFSDLTGGKSGAFYVLHRIMHPQIRNSTGHCDIWIEGDIVHYKEGTIDLLEFMAPLVIATYIPDIYLSSMAAIGLLEMPELHGILPKQLVRMYTT